MKSFLYPVFFLILFAPTSEKLYSQQKVFFVDSAVVDLNPNLDIALSYTILSDFTSCEYEISAFATNISMTQNRSGVRLVVDLYHDSTVAGGPGIGYLGRFYSDTLSVPPFSNQLVSKKFNLSSFTSGYYRACLAIESSSTNINQSYTDTLAYLIWNDTTIARDQGAFTFSFGPSLWQTARDGDAMGVVMSIDSSGHAFASPSSVEVYIPNDTNMIGVRISPRIWQYQNGSVSSNPVGYSPFFDEIFQQDLGTWKNLTIFPPVNLIAGSYIVGVEQVYGQAIGKRLLLGAHSPTTFRGDGNSFVFFNNSAQGQWAARSQMPGIRLNLLYGGCRPIGLVENSTSSETILISPNPSNGVISLDHKLEIDEIFIRDIKGRLVHSQNLQPSQNFLDLSFLNNGIYFIHFRGEEELVNKVVIQK